MSNLRNIRARDHEGVTAIFGIDDLLIVGGLSLAGSLIGGSASKKAAKTAATAATDAASTNNALQRDIYNQNSQTLNPYVQQGYAANNQIAQLLGLSGPAQSAPATNQFAQYGLGGSAPISGATGQDNVWAQYGIENPDVAAEYARLSPNNLRNNYGINTPEEFYQWHYQTKGQGEGRQLPSMSAPAATQQYGEASPAPATGTPTTGTANNAFQNYLDSAGYKFNLQAGADAVRQNAAVGGAGLRSGATLKGLERFGQGLGSNYFQTYLGNLTGQQNVGLSAGNALAGVGTSYANATSANNSAAADATGNAALARASNTNGLIGAGLNAFGTYAGMSSYRKAA